MNNKNLLILIIAVVIILGGILLVLNRNKGSIEPKYTINPEYKVTPKIAPFVMIKVSDKGFSPAQITVDKETLIHFINNTNKTIGIASVSGKNKIEIMPAIASGKTGISLPLLNTGEYGFTLKNETGLKGKIIVR